MRPCPDTGGVDSGRAGRYIPRRAQAAVRTRLMFAKKYVHLCGGWICFFMSHISRLPTRVFRASRRAIAWRAEGCGLGPVRSGAADCGAFGCNGRIRLLRMGGRLQALARVKRLTPPARPVTPVCSGF